MRRAGFLLGSVLLGVTLLAPAGRIEAQNCHAGETIQDCAKRYWILPVVMSSEKVKMWRTALRVAAWQNTDACNRVQAAAKKIFSTDTGWEGDDFDLPDVKATGWARGGYDAQHMHADSGRGRGALVLDNSLTDEVRWRKIQHESGHHAGLTEAEIRRLSVENCAERQKEKENDDDDDDDGGGGGGTGWNPGGTCTTSTVWVTTWVSCSESSNGSSPCNPQCLPGVVACLEKISVPTEVTICD